MLIYLIDERSNLNADVMRDNEKLKILIKLRLDYHIPLLILLTHSDNYCNEVKGQEGQDKKNWKEICIKTLQENKNNLLNYINNTITNEYKSNLVIKEDDIIHVVLIEQNEITNEEIIEKFDENMRNAYEQSNDKNSLIAFFRAGVISNFNEVKNFLYKNGVLGKNELIKKMKLLLPSQYHNTLNNIN